MDDTSVRIVDESPAGALLHELTLLVAARRITVVAGDVGKYTFRVHPDAHKTQIKQAVEQLFNVVVLEVRTSKVPSKPKRRGYTSGRTRSWKKAIVTLFPGQRIDIFEQI